MYYPVILHKDEDSDYGVTVPDLPGCFSAGSTFEQALLNTEEALLTHIEGLMMDNEPIPRPSSIEDLQHNWKGDNGTWALVAVDLEKLSSKTKRINITVPENVLTKIDAYANLAGQSRSGLLVAAALDYITKT